MINFEFFSFLQCIVNFNRLVFFFFSFFFFLKKIEIFFIALTNLIKLISEKKSNYIETIVNDI
jgi:hypothetical protein